MNDQELNEAIAVEVMGYRALIRDPHTGATRWAEPGESLPLYNVEWFDGDRQVTPPTLTGDGMLRLLDEIDRRGWHLLMHVDEITLCLGENDGPIVVEFDYEGRGEKPSDYVPPAIATATLTAVRSQTEEPQPEETP
ncbi:MAG: hypothetical protein AAF663_06360 [Planctomycetota bacterium]